MAFNFDNIVAGAKGIFDKAAEKTGEAIDYSKTQIDRSQTRVKIKEKYGELGRAYYESQMENADRTDEICKLVTEIRDLHKKLSETDTQKEKVCPKCNAVNTPESCFCTACGEKL